MKQHRTKLGILYATAAYILWGFLPVYWKLVENVPAGEILAHRIIWSFVFMLVIVTCVRKWVPFIRELTVIIRDKKKLIGISLAGLIVSMNWLTYIWAVNSDHVVQASLGYYINPLVSILLGIIVLGERLSRRQIISCLLAAAGVIYLTVSFRVFPWVSIILAMTFAVYGLLKKTVDIDTMFGLTIETMVVTPIALIYLLTLPETAFQLTNILTATNLLLMGAGVVTAVPLLLFAAGAKRIPLNMVGFLQYVAPTIMLILGVFVYNEPFTRAHGVAFTLIWIALIIYMGSVSHQPTQKQKAS
ncbi:MAG TPA: EamA family transporter RarD [Bacillota bacterium]|nr:EamA family transporter RarD [Bacillota bacterium]